MTPALVVDISVVTAWALPGEASEYAEGVARAIEGGSVPWASEHLLWETAHALRLAEERGDLPAPLSEKVLVELAKLPWKLEPLAGFAEMNETVDLAKRQGLSLSQGICLYLAKDRELPLATLDSRLVEAARKEGVEVFLGKAEILKH